PSITQEKLDELIDDYQRVLDNEITFTEFIALHIDETSTDEEDIEDKIEQVLTLPISPEDFNQFFKHGKSQETGGAKYLEFIENLLKYRENNSKENYDSLRKISKNSTVKKGFGYGKLPFSFST